MRLFNEQMAPLFEVLEKIEKIMTKEQLTMDNRDIEVIIEKDDDKYSSNTDIDEKNEKLRSLPEWFVRSTVNTELNDD
ncbi:unnamed protein product [Rotaria sp. Silwood1]|nr:unnamed protein product [Rotaria sp. Silwood1]